MNHAYTVRLTKLCRNGLPSQTQGRDHDTTSSGSHQHAHSLVDTLTTQYDRQTVVERQKKHITFSLNRKNEERRESGKRGVIKKLRPPKAAPPSLRSVKGIKKPKIRFSRDVQAASKSVVSSSESEDSRSYIDVDSASDSDQDNAPYQWRQGKLILLRKVTEDDLRAMARFRFEHPPSADESSTGLAYWRRFASIPAVSHRCPLTKNALIRTYPDAYRMRNGARIKGGPGHRGLIAKVSRL